jgi:hypothetical protein
MIYIMFSFAVGQENTLIYWIEGRYFSSDFSEALSDAMIK